MLTDVDVLNHRFRQVWFNGYGQDPVDDLFDAVMLTIRAAQSGGATLHPVTAAELRSTRFPKVRFGPGYDASEVDEYLEQAAATLQQLPTPPRGADAITPPPPPAPVAARTVTPDDLTPVTADDVRQARFQATKARTGYDQDAVDELLGAVIATLDAWHVGTVPQFRVTPEYVVHAELPTVTFREGYDVDQVDALLARVRHTLEASPRA